MFTYWDLLEFLHREKIILPESRCAELFALLNSSADPLLSNGPLDISRMFVYNKRIITISELWHLTELSQRYPDLRLLDKIKPYDHPIFIMSTGNNMIFSSMFTSQSNISNDLIIPQNLVLNNNVFDNVTPILYCSAFEFFNTFMIFNDVNYLPRSLTINNTLPQLINDSTAALHNALGQNDFFMKFKYVNNRRNFQSIYLNSLSLLDYQQLAELITDYTNLQDFRQATVERTVSNFNNHSFYDYRTLIVTNEFKALLPPHRSINF